MPLLLQVTYHYLRCIFEHLHITKGGAGAGAAGVGCKRHTWCSCLVSAGVIAACSAARWLTAGARTDAVAQLGCCTAVQPMSTNPNIYSILATICVL